MRFGIGLLQKFNADDGAWSVITPREEYDSQLTVTDDEARIIEKHFEKKDIHVGRVSLNARKASKRFLLHPKGIPVYLNLVYPKPDKKELRLYLSVRRLFKPSASDIWFVYIKDEVIFIGSMNKIEWSTLMQSKNVDLS